LPPRSTYAQTREHVRRYRCAPAGGPPPQQVGWATLYLELMDFDLPLYAVQRLADGQWLVRTQMGDPLLARPVLLLLGDELKRVVFLVVDRANLS